MQIAYYNTLWAKTLIQTLINSGVRQFFIAPGSRSTPLSMAVAEANIPFEVHFDERGLGFLALGFSKSSKTPCAIITTSGSAVGNLLPAIMEADSSDIPLIILSADRPPELLGIGVNQTTHQIGLFSSFMRYEHNLSAPSPEIDPLTMAQSVAYSVHKAIKDKGPVHLNCPFREPLFLPMQETRNIILPILKTTKYAQVDGFLEKLPKELFQEKGLILLGGEAVSNQEEAELIEAISQKLKWPILADIQSGYRGHAEIIEYSTFLLKANLIPDPNVILHIGGRLTHKKTEAWLKSCSCDYLHVFNSQLRFDPNAQITHQIVLSTKAFCERLLKEPYEANESSWFQDLLSKSTLAKECMDAIFEEEFTLSEPMVTKILEKHFPPNSALFCANSMPIRDMDSFFYPQNGSIPLFVSRGVSGIDGNIATCCGIALKSKTKVVALLGDLAALHDLNSFIIADQLKLPILFVVINNGGGGIFSFLKVAEKNPHFEKLFATPHPYNFSEIASLFNLKYHKADSLEDFESILTTFEGPTLLEVPTNREENVPLHEKLEKAFLDALCYSLSR